MVLVYAHTIFHTPSSNGSLVITIKPKIKYTFHAAATLFLYIPHTKKNLTKVAYFSKIYYYISLNT
jgi:hypothetical protein